MEDTLNESFENLNGKKIDITVTYTMRSVNGSAYVVIDDGNAEHNYSINEVVQDESGNVGLSIEGDYKDAQVEEGYNYLEWEDTRDQASLTEEEIAKKDAAIEEENKDLRNAVYDALRDVFEDY